MNSIEWTACAFTAITQIENEVADVVTTYEQKLPLPEAISTSIRERCDALWSFYNQNRADDRAVLFELQRLKLKKLLKKHNEIVKNIGTNPNAIVYRPERVEEKPVPKAVASQPPRPSRPADEAQPKLSMSQLVNESKPRPESGANTGNPNSRYAFKRDNSPAPLPPPTAQPAPKQLPPVQPKPIEDEGTVAEYKIVLTKAEHDDLRRRRHALANVL